ncbi:hypothetical protein E4T52_16825 [Aureobasidium sp. EXF-3400]|nr:hypothetical protein E4T51_12007 [Aureobasidium sp. EXF-12344]KAI4768071.1 hypothetical protein E4T52_16825 [Aureobasidium sp. EXF-3400]
MLSPNAFADIGGYFYVTIGGFCLSSAAWGRPIASGDKAFVNNDEEALIAASFPRPGYIA